MSYNFLSNRTHIFLFVKKQTLENTEGPIKNGQQRKNWQHRVHNTNRTQPNMCWTPLSVNKHK